jgi:hypothetical protein
MDYDACIKAVRNGDLSGVAKSDKFLRDVEALVPVSRQWATIHSVAGCNPDIIAMNAGIPVHMRQRKRLNDQLAPLTIVAELVASCGIDPDTCRKRGAAILALVRLLSGLRPVELHAIIAVGQHGVRASACIRLDTAPLDLARAAHVLTHPAVFRGLGYGSLRKLMGNWNGNWAFNSVELHRKHAAKFYGDVLCPSSDVFYIPPIHYHDQSVSDPKAWLTDKLREFGGIEIPA